MSSMSNLKSFSAGEMCVNCDNWYCWSPEQEREATNMHTSTQITSSLSQVQRTIQSRNNTSTHKYSFIVILQSIAQLCSEMGVAYADYDKMGVAYADYDKMGRAYADYDKMGVVNDYFFKSDCSQGKNVTR